MTVNGARAIKSALPVRSEDSIVVDDPRSHHVGRAARKLQGALEAFPEVRVAGLRTLDAGASTGGFTQVLLELGARQVVAVDVGRGQLVAEIARDPRVVNLPGTDIRALDRETIGGGCDLIVADLSFISLRLVVPSLAALLAAGGQVVVLVKPQFEAGRAALDSRGVVRDPQIRAAAVADVVRAAEAVGLQCRGVEVSEVAGSAGNVEFFLLLDGHGPPGLDVSEVRDAVLSGESGREVPG